ncbi:CHROMATIN REMODELING 24 [Olea europaea subsp. europaea]|uniref:CHROMATIN REMODELING 24 n=1 Tax=Olea europaea subsp. europaea TaxID=158383 RepID=A0A8S0VA47_OLEEU|nr:CHROMATIN REMODELING 24 [Olea europaea subsp. europaea]
MAEGKKKQPLSLNQLHNRILLDLSASHNKKKPVPRTSSSLLPGKIEVDDSAQSTENENVPRFSGIIDFGSDSLSTPALSTVNDEESELKLEDDSVNEQEEVPNMFAGIVLSDSPSPTLEREADKQSKIYVKTSAGSSNSNFHPSVGEMEVEEKVQSSKVSQNYDNALESNPTFFDVTDNHIKLPGNSHVDSSLPEDEKQMKVKLKGRRRLCKISKSENNDNEGKTLIEKVEPAFTGISDFDSPPQVKTAYESTGNEIRDILNDLSSKLELLSVEKKSVPRKVDLNEDFKDSVRTSYNVDAKKEIPEYRRADSFLSRSSNSSSDSTKESKTGCPIVNEYQKKNCLGTDSDDGDFVCKVNRAKIHVEGLKKNELMRVGVKSVSVNQSLAFNFKREEDGDSDCVVLSDGNNAKRADLRQGKFTQVSDDKSEEIKILDDRVDDFILSGLKCTYRLPSKIAKMLYPHQSDGLKWLWSLHCKGKGGILGDDMGLGKTMQDKGILLTTYDIVRNNTKPLCGDCNYLDDGSEDEMTWDYMILDEGHLIKNPSTQRAKSLLQIPCARRIIISGTPLQNNLKELWALFNFCCPELLGDKKWFKEKYEHYINRGNEKNASDREKRIGSAVAKELRECIQPYFLRRMKSEVFRDDTTLSKKNEIIVWLRLTGLQRQLYEAFLKSEIVISACDGSPLAALTILKKICDHPLLLTKRAAEEVLEGMDSMVGQEDRGVAEKLAMHIADVADKFDFIEKHNVSCKISFILSLLGDLLPKGHKVLIFSQTRKMLNLIQESLMSSDYKFLRIDGNTKASDRAAIVKDFQEGCGAPIFLLTSQVGGLGLTLTKADRVIVVDPAWNPSMDNQSVDRAYRIGQKKDVIVYRLMTCSTVEEKIYRKQVFKGGLFKSATEHKEQIRYFSQQDLRDLFSLPKQGFDISLTQQQLHEEHDQQHTMEESVKAHVEFLQTLNIAGVSQHSLLFSKTAPVPDVQIEEEVRRVRGSTFTDNSSSRLSHEYNVDGADYAFKPKDVHKVQKIFAPAANEPSETEITERIHRLSQMLTNKVAVSRLPDKGEKIHKQIAELRLQLDQRRMAKGSKDVIDLDSITAGIQKVVNL